MSSRRVASAGKAAEFVVADGDVIEGDVRAVDVDDGAGEHDRGRPQAIARTRSCGQRVDLTKLVAVAGAAQTSGYASRLDSAASHAFHNSAATSEPVSSSTSLTRALGKTG